jgi:hypothetical protein
LISEPPYLSEKLRQEWEQAERERWAAALAAPLGAQLVEQVEHVLAERYAAPLVEPVAGRVGYQDLLRPTDPTPGADLVYVVGGEAALWPLSVMATLTTDGTAGLRSLTLQYRDGDGIRYLVAGANVQLAASQEQAFCWQPEAGVGSWPVDDAAISPLPQQHLYPGHQLCLHIAGAKAGDQLSEIRLSVQLYPTGPRES